MAAYGAGWYEQMCNIEIKSDLSRGGRAGSDCSSLITANVFFMSPDRTEISGNQCGKFRFATVWEFRPKFTVTRSKGAGLQMRCEQDRFNIKQDRCFTGIL